MSLPVRHTPYTASSSCPSYPFLSLITMMMVVMVMMMMMMMIIIIIIMGGPMFLGV
jgi:hypothetical protein